MKEQTFDIPALPNTVEEFLSLRGDLATTPHGGAVVYAVALVTYAGDPELGLQMLTIAMDVSELSDGSVYKGKAPGRRRLQELKERIGARPYVARSYIQGTSPENQYAIPSGPLQVKIREQVRDVADDRAKVFVHSTGADSPRPITLLKNSRGVWKAKAYGSLDVGVRPPVAATDDDL